MEFSQPYILHGWPIQPMDQWIW